MPSELADLFLFVGESALKIAARDFGANGLLFDVLEPRAELDVLVLDFGDVGLQGAAGFIGALPELMCGAQQFVAVLSS